MLRHVIVADLELHINCVYSSRYRFKVVDSIELDSRSFKAQFFWDFPGLLETTIQPSDAQLSKRADVLIDEDVSSRFDPRIQTWHLSRPP